MSMGRSPGQTQKNKEEQEKTREEREDKRRQKKKKKGEARDALSRPQPRPRSLAAPRAAPAVPATTPARAHPSPPHPAGSGRVLTATRRGNFSSLCNAFFHVALVLSADSHDDSHDSHDIPPPRISRRQEEHSRIPCESARSHSNGAASYHEAGYRLR